MFVILVGVWKEGWSDLKRQLSDRRVNRKAHTKVTRLSSLTPRFLATEVADGLTEANNRLHVSDSEMIKSKDIAVGDILWLHDDEIVPSDCIVLQTHMLDGSCMVSTEQLDGERTLKPKYAIEQT